MNLTISKVLLNPELAGEFLKSNTHNRNIKTGVVRALSAAMKRGEWQVNGDTITFDESGKLIDGQHRLLAVIDSAFEYEAIVVRNAPDGSFTTKDIGSKRTGGDVLSIENIKNSNVCAAIALSIHKWNITKNPYNGNPDSSASTSKILEMVLADPQISRSADFSGSSVILRKLIPPSILGFCHYMFCMHDENACNSFFSCLDSGEKGYPNSPIMLLRDALTLDLGGRKKMTRHYKTALIFKAFKHFKDRRQIKLLRIRLDGDAPETDLFIL